MEGVSLEMRNLSSVWKLASSGPGDERNLRNLQLEPENWKQGRGGVSLTADSRSSHVRLSFFGARSSHVRLSFFGKAVILALSRRGVSKSGADFVKMPTAA